MANDNSVMILCSSTTGQEQNGSKIQLRDLLKNMLTDHKKQMFCGKTPPELFMVPHMAPFHYRIKWIVKNALGLQNIQ